MNTTKVGVVPDTGYTSPPDRHFYLAIRHPAERRGEIFAFRASEGPQVGDRDRTTAVQDGVDGEASDALDAVLQRFFSEKADQNFHQSRPDASIWESFARDKLLRHKSRRILTENDYDWLAQCEDEFLGSVRQRDAELVAARITKIVQDFATGTAAGGDGNGASNPDPGDKSSSAESGAPAGAGKEERQKSGPLRQSRFAPVAVGHVARTACSKLLHTLLPRVSARSPPNTVAAVENKKDDLVCEVFESDYFPKLKNNSFSVSSSSSINKGSTTTRRGDTTPARVVQKKAATSSALVRRVVLENLSALDPTFLFDEEAPHSVLSVQHASPVSIAGVLVGDELLAINGQRPKKFLQDSNSTNSMRQRPLALLFLDSVKLAGLLAPFLPGVETMMRRQRLKVQVENKQSRRAARPAGSSAASSAQAPQKTKGFATASSERPRGGHANGSSIGTSTTPPSKFAPKGRQLVSSSGSGAGSKAAESASRMARQGDEKSQALSSTTNMKTRGTKTSEMIEPTSKTQCEIAKPKSEFAELSPQPKVESSGPTVRGRNRLQQGSPAILLATEPSPEGAGASAGEFFDEEPPNRPYGAERSTFQPFIKTPAQERTNEAASFLNALYAPKASSDETTAAAQIPLCVVSKSSSLGFTYCGSVSAGHVLVRTVLPDSLPALLGVTPGTAIASVNGVRVSSTTIRGGVELQSEHHHLHQTEDSEDFLDQQLSKRPCVVVFDPPSSQHLRQLELENKLFPDKAEKRKRVEKAMRFLAEDLFPLCPNVFVQNEIATSKNLSSSKREEGSGAAAADADAGRRHEIRLTTSFADLATVLWHKEKPADSLAAGTASSSSASSAIIRPTTRELDSTAEGSGSRSGVTSRTDTAARPPTLFDQTSVSDVGITLWGHPSDRVFVSKVTYPSVADSHGIRIGAELVKINGFPLPLPFQDLEKVEAVVNKVAADGISTEVSNSVALDFLQLRG
ncbi:unnamed protein product [Amoebophrya sp. A120]|nr:unnamed protein product [Amoebophrya sp. A120]|eukprot:GSA120T00021442001.1